MHGFGLCVVVALFKEHSSCISIARQSCYHWLLASESESVVLVPIVGSLPDCVVGREPQVVLREEWWASTKSNGTYPSHSPDITHEAHIDMLVARSMELGT